MQALRSRQIQFENHEAQSEIGSSHCAIKHWRATDSGLTK